MIKYILQFVFLLIPCLITAQITKSYNSIRVGDELIKSQVDSKKNGLKSQTVIGDFGKLQFINYQYTLSFQDLNQSI